MSDPLLRQSFSYREQDPDYRGEKCDEEYGNGPITQRKCTDLFCCLIFIVFLVGVGYIAFVAFNTGNPEYLVYPFDSNQKQCGFSVGYQDYPYIFIGENNGNLQFVCVKQCPLNQNSTLDCKTGGDIPDCNLLVYPAQPIFTYCLPLNETQIVAGRIINQVLSIDVLQQYFADIYVSWHLILAMVGVSLVVSILYSVLIRYFAGCMVYTMFILLIIISLILGLALVLLPTPQLQFIRDLLKYDSLPDVFKDRTYQIVLAILNFVVFLISFCIFCCMRKQIKISIGIIKAAADFVRDCCSAFLIPLYIAILQLIFLAFWVVVILFLFSSNTGTITPIDHTPFGMVDWNNQNRYLIIFYIFALLWVINFFSGISSFWTSSTAAIWYFEDGQPKSPLLRSICRSFYHLGSIAFGSLLIAIIMFIRIVLQFLTTQLKQKTMGNEGKAVGFIIKCATCIVACFQRIVRFITQNAYIMMAITGKNFCACARESFYLMLRSTSQFFISHGTTKLFIFVGTVLIITMSITVGYLFITNIEPYKNQIHSPVFLTIIFAIAAAPVSWAFMQFFQKAANTILVCYCVELDLNKKKSKCPTGLKRFLDDTTSNYSSISRNDR